MIFLFELIACQGVTILSDMSLVHYILFFFIRTSNSGAEAERSYVLLQFEPETFLTCSLCSVLYFNKFMRT